MLGIRYGSRVVIEDCGTSKNGQKLWKCVCDCGTETITSGSSIRRSKSCGCKSRKTETHGMTNSRAFRIWTSMRRRCKDKENPNYGGRGIHVCERWGKFENFYSDMGDPPDNYSIDRINNDGIYEPENCRWASAKEQNGNQRTTLKLTYQGETFNLTDWARKIGTSPAALHYRISKLKLPLDIAISTPFTRSNSIKKFK